MNKFQIPFNDLEQYEHSDEYKTELQTLKKSIRKRKFKKVFCYFFITHIWDLIIVLISVATLIITIFK